MAFARCRSLYSTPKLKELHKQSLRTLSRASARQRRWKHLDAFPNDRLPGIETIVLFILGAASCPFQAAHSITILCLPQSVCEPFRHVHSCRNDATPCCGNARAADSPSPAAVEPPAPARLFLRSVITASAAAARSRTNFATAAIASLAARAMRRSRGARFSQPEPQELTSSMQSGRQQATAQPAQSCVPPQLR